METKAFNKNSKSQQAWQVLWERVMLSWAPEHTEKHGQDNRLNEAKDLENAESIQYKKTMLHRYLNDAIEVSNATACSRESGEVLVNTNKSESSKGGLISDSFSHYFQSPNKEVPRTILSIFPLDGG